MRVLTAAQMREADRRAMDAGTPSLILMENAAFAFLRQLEESFPALERERIAIFCGKGNNGGDGLALARLLRVHRGARGLCVLLAGEPEGDAATQIRMLEGLDVRVMREAPPDLAATTLAIDSLLGTGSTGEPRGRVAELLQIFNNLPAARRWAIDVPTGLGSPSGARVETTVTFAAPKLELVYGAAAESVGRLVVVDIGIPERFLESTLHWTDRSDLTPVLKRRSRDVNKGSFGHVAVLGGAAGKSGALQLACTAALRMGAGLVTAFSPDPGFRPTLPDVMQGAWPEDTAVPSPCTTIAVGPGLGAVSNEAEWLAGWVREEARPMVVDADALNRLAPWSIRVAAGRLRVLTPHPKEMARLLGRPLGDRLAEAQEFAERWNVVLVLKGHRTLIAFPDGKTWINPTGSPALAKGGTGDVFTGMIAGLLAQFPDESRAVILAAAYLHGRCGEMARHERTLLASELESYFGEALLELQ